MRLAVNIALRHLDRLMPGERLNVARAAAGLMRISRRRSKRRFDTREGAPATGAEAQAIKARHAVIALSRAAWGASHLAPSRYPLNLAQQGPVDQKLKR